MELTDREANRLERHTGTKGEMGPLDIDPDSDEPLSPPWRLDDDRSGVTLEMCNALRCAAHDDLPYREIADTFSFCADAKHAHIHATGDCRHAGGVEPVASKRPAGPPAGRVSGRLCGRLRRRYGRGEFDTYQDAADWADIARSAAWRHINGECDHS